MVSCDRIARIGSGQELGDDAGTPPRPLQQGLLYAAEVKETCFGRDDFTVRGNAGCAGAAGFCLGQRGEELREYTLLRSKLLKPREIPGKNRCTAFLQAACELLKQGKIRWFGNSRSVRR